MKTFSLRNILLGKKYIGIEHFSTNEEMVSFLLIKKIKNELVIDAKDKILFNETIPEKWIKKNLPFYLIINSNQVIQKEIEFIDPSDEKLLNKAFPNFELQEFYYEIWRLKTRSIVAISRKTYIYELLSVYSKQNISIVGISLGVCSLTEIIRYSEQKEFMTNNQTVILDQENQMITNFSVTTVYTINGLKIKNDYLLTLSGILRIVFNNLITTGNIADFNNNLLDNYNQKRFFSIGVKISIGVLLLILLTNFFIFTNYFKAVQESSDNLLLNKALVETIINSRKHIKEKEGRIKNAIELNSTKSSFIINEIIKKNPQSISLTELIYNPLEKKIKIDELIIIKEKTLVISGETIDNNSFIYWIEELQKLKWINQVIITSFGKNDMNKTIFSIKIILKNENK